MNNLEKYVPGQVVEGKVYQIHPFFGVLVRLKDGTKGFIRRRELSWSEREPDPWKIVREGQAIEAVVLSRDKKKNELSLSLRFREKDPWQGIEKKHPVGAMVEGTVTNLLSEHGAFVEIEPGVDGFIPISQVHPEKAIKKVEEALWIEDRVRALVTGLNTELRHIHLSVKAYFEKEQQESVIVGHDGLHGVSMEEMLPPEAKERLYKTLDEETDFKKFELIPNRIRKILIIDDNPDFGNPLIDWLDRKRYEARLETKGADGVENAGKNSYDLIVLDSHLPDISGIQVAEKIRASRPGVPILFVTGYEYAEDLQQAAELGLPVWFKPIGEQELVEILACLEEHGEIPSRGALPEAGQPQALPQVGKSFDIRKPLFHNLNAILEDLADELHLDSLALFRLDRKKYKVFIEAGKGVPELLDEQSHNLMFSPIRDVIQSNKVLHENKVSPGPFQYMLKWMPFRSCIGAPVPSLEQRVSHALFAFHASAGFFQDHHLLRMQASAAYIGAALEFQRSVGQLQQAQKWILQGQLGAGMLHEVHNRLGGALILSTLMQNVFETAAGELASQWSKLKEYTHKLSENLNKTAESVQLFRKLSREEAWEEIDVNAALRKMKDILTPMANKRQVEIKFNPGDAIPRIKTIGVRLDHVFGNIMLNAVEWMAYRPRACLTISSAYQPEDPEKPVKLYFADTGPGIHRALFDSIFEMGFTTKEDGTGLGLFIAKRLVESIGGAISLNQSIVFFGSIFLIELPINPIFR